MYHVFEVDAPATESIAANIGFKEMRTSTFDTKEGKSMKLHRIPVYAKNPKTRTVQDAILRLPQQMISAAYGESTAAKIRAVIDVVQNSEAVEQCFNELADATLPTLQKVAMATNRKFSNSDIDGLRVRTCGDGGSCKLFVDVYRHGNGSRVMSRFYRDTEDMPDVDFTQLFSSADADAQLMKRRKVGDAPDDGRSISITPFKCELLLHIESVLICPASLKFVMSVREGVVPPDVGIQYSVLRKGKTWGPKVCSEPNDETNIEEDCVHPCSSPQPSPVEAESIE